MTDPVVLQAGDIVLTRNRGLVSSVIRLFTRSIGESRTQASHVGVIVQSGPIRSCVLVEALHKVKRHPLWSRYARSDADVAVYRPVTLEPESVQIVVEKAESYVGRRYGYGKLVAHWLDWVLLGAYVFRRLASEDRYPICSWVVAHSFAAAGKTFGVEPGAATPDDIWDFVTGRTDQYLQIIELGPLTG